MLDSIIASPFGLAAICAALAALVVLPAYLSPAKLGLATAAPLPEKFPLRSFARTAMVVFVVLINGATVLLAHRFPLGTDLIMAGFLLLLFAPADSGQLEA